MTLYSSLLALAFDGRGYGLYNCIVTHRPRTASAAKMVITGIDANGTPWASDVEKDLMTTTGGAYCVDVIRLPPDPLLAVRWELQNAENTAELISVQFTAAIPAEVTA
jgi:hypothetical protein